MHRFYIKKVNPSLELMQEQNDLLRKLLVTQEQIRVEIAKQSGQTQVVVQQVAAQNESQLDSFANIEFEDEVYIPKANLKSEVSLNTVTTSSADICDADIAKLKKLKDK